MKKSNFAAAIALLYVCLLLYTGISKLISYELSREQMSIMPLVGPVAGLVTWSLPAFEILLALVIFIPKTRKPGLYAGTALMFAFTIYVAYLMKYHSHLPCTCGGLLQSLSWPQHLAFNISFVILGIVDIALDRKPSSAAAANTLSYLN